MDIIENISNNIHLKLVSNWDFVLTSMGLSFLPKPKNIDFSKSQNHPPILRHLMSKICYVQIELQKVGSLSNFMKFSARKLNFFFLKKDQLT